jgi:hypothetical protein
MVKLLSFLSRKRGISQDRFMKSWVDEAPLFFKEFHACRRYMQYRLHLETKQRSSMPVMDLVLDCIEEFGWRARMRMRKSLFVNSVGRDSLITTAVMLAL